jgi:hypothetical protein
MKKRNLVLVILAILLVFGLVVSCGDDLGGDPNAPAKLSNAVADGGGETTTTKITLTFSKAVTGLTAEDVALTGAAASKVTKGALTGSGTSWSLALSAVTGSGSVTVDVKGVDGTKTASIYHYPTELAKKYFSSYSVTYSGNNESVEISATTLKIIEKTNETVNDSLTFAISGWDLAEVPASEVNADASARGQFKVGLKVLGKVTDVSNGYKVSSKTMPGVEKDDPTSYIFIYLADYKMGDELVGYLLLRTAISCATKENTKTGVTGDGTSGTRVYKWEFDD